MYYCQEWQRLGLLDGTADGLAAQDPPLPAEQLEQQPEDAEPLMTGAAPVDDYGSYAPEQHPYTAEPDAPQQLEIEFSSDAGTAAVPRGSHEVVPEAVIQHDLAASNVASVPAVDEPERPLEPAAEAAAPAHAAPVNGVVVGAIGTQMHGCQRLTEDGV
eukprot:TRINITY_DN93386_c0_g1_i1.p3 TRINITY_DN93386_c0_g1~~TRINITY_DN93386_c0_g1_i1.p3  ORF type:complete len:159 (-),score=35.87 TRINITY_DN93386_c0_g1_i1:20-496(-)